MSIRQRVSGAGFMLAALIADRVTKVLMSREGAGWVWPGVVCLRRVENTGMAFSMFGGMPAVLTALSTLIVCGIAVWLLLGKSRDRLLRAGLWLTAGGGLGNVIDRVLYGAVTDFIEPLFVGFAVFNVADIAVCVGVGLTVLAILTEKE